MPAFLMPQQDKTQALDQKLLDLAADSQRQYEAMNKLSIPEKTRKIAQGDYQDCLEKFLALPNHASILDLAEKKPADHPFYRETYRELYLKFFDFYKALEILIVRHYLGYQFIEGNDYLKNALANIPEKEKNTLQVIPTIKPHSPRSPRMEEQTNKDEKEKPHHRKRSNSHTIAPLSWFKSAVKTTGQAKPAHRDRSNSEFKK